MTTQLKKFNDQEKIHLILLREAIRGLNDVATGKILSLKKIKARYGR